jgi:hypothetical protein
LAADKRSAGNADHLEMNTMGLFGFGKKKKDENAMSCGSAKGTEMSCGSAKGNDMSCGSAKAPAVAKTAAAKPAAPKKK